MDIEWELLEEAFRVIVKKFGVPEIDLFASRINKKCWRYCSWERDPDASAISNLTIECKKLFCFLPWPKVRISWTLFTPEGTTFVASTIFVAGSNFLDG